MYEPIDPRQGHHEPLPEEVKRYVNENQDPNAEKPPTPPDRSSMNAGGIERFAAALARSKGKQQQEPKPYEAIDPKTNNPLGLFANTAMGDLANLQVSDYGQIKG